MPVGHSFLHVWHHVSSPALHSGSGGVTGSPRRCRPARQPGLLHPTCSTAPQLIQLILTVHNICLLRRRASVEVTEFYCILCFIVWTAGWQQWIPYDLGLKHPKFQGFSLVYNWHLSVAFCFYDYKLLIRGHTQIICILLLIRFEYNPSNRRNAKWHFLVFLPLCCSGKEEQLG